MPALRRGKPGGVLIAEVVGVGITKLRELIDGCGGVCVRVVEGDGRLSSTGLAGAQSRSLHVGYTFLA